MTETLTLAIDSDGIALVTIDVPDQSMNVVTPALQRDLGAAFDRIVADSAIKGAVLTSGKSNGFVAGADLKGMAAAFLAGHDAEKSRIAGIYEAVFALSALYRRIETCGKPVAVAINGLALGGGLELCLACHYRIAADNPKLQLGLPEVLVGLLPGAGGTQRLPRLMGVQNALLYITQGKSMSPAEAKGFGVIHDVAPAAELVERARAWVLANPQGGVAPWDQKGFKFPGGAGATNPAFVQTFVGANAMVTAKTLHNMHAPHAILSAVYEGAQLPIDMALKVEAKYFAKLFADPQATAMIRTLFVSKQAAEKGARRPKDEPPAPTMRLAMLGAGMMGAGIAMVSAQAGIEVVLLDRDLESAEKGKAYAAEKLAKKRLPQDKVDSVLTRIRPTTDFADLAGCDLIIEAVFEDRAIKAETTKKTEAVLGPDVIFGSNTSTLPITGLAEAWSKPANFIGIHFFSPVDKMPLVEIIVGKKTGSRAIAKALDYVRQIKKTPIVVNDSRGFYTSRCFATYVQEGTELLGEGVSPALIENCGRQIGMPVGPLAVSDEVSIELGYKVMQAAQRDLGDAYVPSRADDVIRQMVDMGRLGRKAAKGYYDYPADGRKSLWPGLRTQFATRPDAEQPAAELVRERLLYRQIVECLRCYEEGVLETPQDGDLGAIFGWGFAPHTGGPFSLVDSLGAKTVVARLDSLASRHGPRFAPPALLRRMAEEGTRFY